MIRRKGEEKDESDFKIIQSSFRLIACFLLVFFTNPMNPAHANEEHPRLTKDIPGGNYERANRY